MLYKQDVKRYQTKLRNVSPRYTTRDGRKLTLRLLHPSDAPLLVEMFHLLTPETRRRRFHIGVENVSEEVVHQRSVELADVDNKAVSGAIVAVYKDETGEHIVGSVRLARDPAAPESPEAEAAIVVRDDFQGQGVGTELMRRLVLLAKQMNVKKMVAIFQPDNEDAIRIFREVNLPYVTTIDHGETILTIEVPSEP
ncbi:MAG: GNAT family N-acetyltransferase [Caldilineaceae bacterium]